MSSIETSEKWQVDVSGTIYEASFDELPSWIVEGSLQPTDKVRKGNLRWIEAAKVPSMIPLFEAKAKGIPAPGPDGQTHKTSVDEPVAEPTLYGEIDPQAAPEKRVTRAAVHPTNDPALCSIHFNEIALYACSACSGSFCGTCPRSYGGNVKICPECGAMCRSLKEIKAEVKASDRQAVALSEGFGFGDFANAISHPFRFKFSLFAGALMFAFFSLGQSASVIGGIEMIVASVFCVMLANMLTFGILANTADNFSRGDCGENFMPAFEEFSVWDDVIHPFVLSVGAYISAFGAFAIVALIGLYLVSSSVDSKMTSLQAELEKIPGTQFYTAKDTVKQSDEVRNVLAESQQQNAKRLQLENDIAGGNVNTAAIDGEASDLGTVLPDTGERNNAAGESAVAKPGGTREIEERETLQSALGLPPVLVVVGALAFLWGLFYFPVACMVAGFSRTFSDVINPLVGLDTIKRLGSTYVKLLLMCSALLLALVAVRLAAATVFASLYLPGFGNLPAKLVGSLFGFYLWVVFSCLIGYSLFKSSDRLHLNK
ncbi:MAG: hypothetical protein ABI791_04945 [Acidobacteriota bacterium]